MIKIDNPAFDYDQSGQKYSKHRQTEPEIEARIKKVLGDAKTVLNVGAGAGSYEPIDRYVVAVEPSAEMRKQRLENNKIPAINAKGETLPFDDAAFDVAMAMITIHHWPNMEKGIKELCRLAKQKVIIMTFDPDALDTFWNANYFPELIEVEKARYPTIDFIVKALNGNCEVINIPIPLNCKDGFQEAFYGRPEGFLKKEVRLAQSAWGFLSDELQEQLVKRLAIDLQSGAWDKKYGHLRTQASFEGALRLVVLNK